MDPSISNITFQNIQLLACGHALEFPDSGIDCSTSNPNFCVRCRLVGRFAAGGSINDLGTGHMITVLEWIMTMIVGVSGIFTNFLIITITRRQKHGQSFAILLTALASIDIVGSVTSVVATTTTVGLYQGWSRNLIGQYLYCVSTLASLFARSGSSFMTVLITAERYLVITFPTSAPNWFTPRKTKFYAAVVLLFSACLAYPRFASFTIAPNDFGKDIPSMKNLDYIILGSSQLQLWYVTAGGFFDKIDFWVPLPLLTILNLLVFIEIWKLSRRRKDLNLSRKKDIQAMKMFLPVVGVLFLCNVLPYVFYYYMTVHHRIYRELLIGTLMSIAVNSFVNFFFYMRADSFKKEFRQLVKNYFGDEGRVGKFLTGLTGNDKITTTTQSGGIEKSQEVTSEA